MKEKGQVIKIERVKGGEHPSSQFVGHVPMISGEFDVEGKRLSVIACPQGADLSRKVIFSGDVFPTIKERGKVGQFVKVSGRRRVLNFSNDPLKRVVQASGPDEYLVFTRIQTSLDAAAD